MKYSLLLFAIGVATASSSFGGERVRDLVATKLGESTFHASLKPGYHFNKQAPNAVVLDEKSFKPSKLEGGEAEFTALPKEWASGRASLYVCDDAVTFCEPHFIDLKGTSANPKFVAEPTKKRPTVKNAHGFFIDDFSQAIVEAKKRKQLVLVDFSARWCPSCIRLENEIFPTAAFKKLSRDFVKVKIDVDRFENAVLSERFSIKGIPTILLLDANQQEIDRISDYQPMDVFKKYFAAVKEDPTPLDALKEKAKSGDAALIERLGKRLAASERFKESLDFLTRIRRVPPPPELLLAKVGAAAATFAADAASKPAYIQTLKDALAAEPRSSRSLLWRQELVGLIDDKAEVTKIMQEGVALADGLLTDSAQLTEALKTDLVGEFTGYEPMLVAINRAELVEAAKPEPDVVDLAWKKAADIGRQFKYGPAAPGPSLRYLLILGKAKLYEDADRLVLALLKADSHNPELQRRRLKILYELKRFNEAITLGQACLKNSYDRNEYWVVEILAKAHIGAQQNAAAKVLIDRYLGRGDADWPLVQASRKKLEELRRSL